MRTSRATVFPFGFATLGLTAGMLLALGTVFAQSSESSEILREYHQRVWTKEEGVNSGVVLA